MKDLIIGCADNYNWDKIKYWANSVDKCGFKGDKLIVFGNVDLQTVQKCSSLGWMIQIMGHQNQLTGNFEYRSQNRLTIHVERFMAIWNALHQIGKNYNHVIHTDVKDVVFQTNPSDWINSHIGDKQLITGSESLRYCDEPWGKQNMLETFGQWYYEIHGTDEIFNVGVLAGKSEVMKDLFMMIFQLSLNRPIPIVDQAVFNYIIQTKPWKDITLFAKSEMGFACQAGTTVDPTKINYFRPNLLEATPTWDGTFAKTSTGHTHCILHQYDRVPNWRLSVEQRYG